MAVPSKLADLNTTESSNFPVGSESIGISLDNYIRATQAILKQSTSKGSDIASSNSITIPTAGNYHVVSGTTTITEIADSWNGRISVLKFSGSLSLTNSSKLILFGGDLSVSAGDILTVVNESAGVYRAISFSKASGGYITAAGTDTLSNKTIVAANNTITTAASGTLTQTELNAVIAEIAGELLLKAALASPTFTGTPTLPTGTIATTQSEDDNSTKLATTSYTDTQAAKSGITLGTEQATTSGTSIDFTSIPSGVKWITINFVGVSTNGTSGYLLQIGGSGGIEATGYLGAGSRITGANACGQTASTAGFNILMTSAIATHTIHGSITLNLENATGFTWVETAILSDSAGNGVWISSGSKSLSAELDRIRITTATGVNTFDAGAINISYGS